jgi:rfaE bifunctional protein kinase chain/domain
MLVSELSAAEQATYKRKIKTREELLAIVGSFPRTKKVIMCHGTFDLVHPGHVRHLIYAKSKGDVLVASLTSDVHIAKANYRPYVPQALRAMNLAALEIVDYVIVDDNPEPIENILFLKPDLFAKGYEYHKEGIHPKTQQEMSALESYGGEVLFTPGDIVYSSSHIIEQGPPNLRGDKLHALLEAEGIQFGDLFSTLDSFAGVKVHIIGDMIVDSYTYCSLIGGNTKTPTFSLRFDEQIDFVGGAGIVAKHMKKAGADVTLTTVLGDDELGRFVLADLEAAGVRVNADISKNRPTTQKNLFTTQGYRMLKVDKVDNRPVSGKVLKDLCAAVRDIPADAVVFSDFRHGIFSAATIPELTASLPSTALKVADSQVASRWGNILEFEGFDLITPNEREARFALGDQDSTIRPLALELYLKAKCKYLMLKMGKKGMITYREPSPEVRSFFNLDTFTDNVVDPVGAGDALLSYATLALVRGRCPVIASVLGAVAASLACERDGNTPIELAEARKKLEQVRKDAQFE